MLEAENSSHTNSSETDSIEFINGADLSFTPQMQDYGGVFYNDLGVPNDPLQIFKDHGFNYIRLKIWHMPVDDYDNLEKILLMASRIKEKNMKFLLDFHYSDTWADPGKQYKPAAWEDLSFAVLKDSLYQYTRNVIQALYDQGTLPDMVQIGNEIISGMLWDDGRVGGSFDTPEQWNNLGELLKSGIQGVRESCEAGDSVRIMIHIDRGANNGSCQWFYNHMLNEGVDFDVIGLSYYPWWHGTLSQVRSNINDLAIRYNKDIIIVEAAYPWIIDWHDSKGNIVGSSDDLHDGYLATVNGQMSFFRDLIKIIRQTNNGKGKGLFYWAPDWIPVDPPGSSWENVTLFDFDGKVLSSMDVFLEEPVVLDPVNIKIRLNTSTHWDTLRPYHFAQLRGDVSGNSFGTLPDGNEVTWESDSDLILENTSGDYWEVNFQMYPGDQLTYKFWTGYTRDQATFSRSGWEGPIIPYGDYGDNSRVFVAGESDSVLNLEFFSPFGTATDQYWRPYEEKIDSVAIYFHVNMSNVTASDRFDPDLNGPVTVRGDSLKSGGSLSWIQSKVILQREIYSVNDGSFWSGTCYIPKNSIVSGDTLNYNFFIENDSQNGRENSIAHRQLIFTDTFSDTTLHWVYFDECDITGIQYYSDIKKPESFGLNQNYPNPFNNQTRIEYKIENPGLVTLSIYNARGQLISTLANNNQTAGYHSINWSAYNSSGLSLPSGIYYIRLMTNQGSQTRKALLIK